jgi:hypothetical protein
MYDELERIWKEAVVDPARYYHGISLKGLMEINRNLSHDTNFPAEVRNEYYPHASLENYRYMCYTCHI